MKRISLLWTVFSAIYMAALSLFCLFDAISVIQITEGRIPSFGLVLLLMVSCLFAALTTVALAKKWQSVGFLFWSFCLAWSLTTYVDASIFTVMCITDTGWFITLVIAILVPTGIGFFLVRKARSAQLVHAGPISAAP